MRIAAPGPDIYLDVGDTGASFEIANAWDAETDIAFTDEGSFRDNRICQSGYDWVPSVRATRRSDGTVIGGRDLHALRLAIYDNQGAALGTGNDRFDHLFVSAEPVREVVTLHFNAGDAAGPTPRW